MKLSVPTAIDLVCGAAYGWANGATAENSRKILAAIKVVRSLKCAAKRKGKRA